MKLLFVRHGKSLANAASTIGTPDTPLAEEGIEQAHTTGRDLKSQHVTAIVCSPFPRARQTAEIIAGELGLPIASITLVDELHERRMGELEGGPKRHETAFFYENDATLGFESHADLIHRMQTALRKVEKIAEQTPGVTVVVGHATSGFFFLQVAKGKSRYGDFDEHFQMDNAAFVEVEQTRH